MLLGIVDLGNFVLVLVAKKACKSIKVLWFPWWRWTVICDKVIVFHQKWIYGCNPCVLTLKLISLVFLTKNALTEIYYYFYVPPKFNFIFLLLSLLPYNRFETQGNCNFLMMICIIFLKLIYICILKYKQSLILKFQLFTKWVSDF